MRTLILVLPMPLFCAVVSKGIVESSWGGVVVGVVGIAGCLLVARRTIGL